MTDENASLPPAGWYPDPEVAGGERWWDGAAWSTHQRAATVDPPATPDPAPAAETFTAPEAPVAAEATFEAPVSAPPAPAPLDAAVPVAPSPGYAYAPGQPAPAQPAASPYVAPPVYGYGGGYAAQPANVPALVGLILSIVGVAIGWIFAFFALAAVAGLIVSIIGLRTGARMRAEGNPGHRSGMALAGIIVGAVGTLIGLIVVIASIAFFLQFASYSSVY